VADTVLIVAVRPVLRLSGSVTTTGGNVEIDSVAAPVSRSGRTFSVHHGLHSIKSVIKNKRTILPHAQIPRAGSTSARALRRRKCSPITATVTRRAITTWPFLKSEPRNQVRTRLPAGGRWIRTIGPPSGTALVSRSPSLLDRTSNPVLQKECRPTPMSANSGRRLGNSGPCAMLAAGAVGRFKFKEQAPRGGPGEMTNRKSARPLSPAR
jgi:hypothetical protein